MKHELIDKIINIYQNSPRVAILMSGKGSNAEAILKNKQRYKNINFITICTDKQNSNALQLSEKYNLSHFCLEGNVSSIDDRDLYFQKLADYLSELKIDTLLYAGFMKICPEFFLKKFPGINLHPSDLTITDRTGKPKYTGIYAIRDAIKANESYLASTAHVIDSEVDCGMPIIVSKHFLLKDHNIQDISALHEQLKINCEHLLYPYVIERLSQGNINSNELPYKWNEVVL